ncbi:MAG TPA: YbfB/YjiJ family MFS transporter, partial [Rhodanobacter sp.]
MQRASSDHASAARIAFAGLIALAVAMGIGRFAFTPILPMMQADAGLTLKAAGWLAAANYLGYLLGALCAARLPRAWAIRGGLLLIALATFAMGVTHVFALQLILRLLAGIASAWVLVHVSAWALDHLHALGRADASGVVYAGVGIGIAGAGLLCMALMAGHAGSVRTWEVFGLASLVFTAATWRAFRADARHVAAAGVMAQRLRWNPDRVRV